MTDINKSRAAHHEVHVVGRHEESLGQLAHEGQELGVAPRGICEESGVAVLRPRHLPEELLLAAGGCDQVAREFRGRGGDPRALIGWKQVEGLGRVQTRPGCGRGGRLAVATLLPRREGEGVASGGHVQQAPKERLRERCASATTRDPALRCKARTVQSAA
jgi:hypothetical protein